jgi:ribonuclease P protein component
VLQARRRAETGAVRVGFTVSRQVGNAVERNRVRRRLREIVRLMPDGVMRPGHDYVLIARRAALALPFGTMARELDAALGRIHAAAAADESGERGGRKGTGSRRGQGLHEPGSPRADAPPNAAFAAQSRPPPKPRRKPRDT